MNRLKLLSTLCVMPLAFALAIPFETSASFVTGGETPDCGVLGRALSPCGSQGEGTCPFGKYSCIGCGIGTKKFVCVPGGSACGGSPPLVPPSPFCTANQHHQSTNGDCIQNDCNS